MYPLSYSSTVDTVKGKPLTPLFFGIFLACCWLNLKFLEIISFLLWYNIRYTNVSSTMYMLVMCQDHLVLNTICLTYELRYTKSCRSKCYQTQSNVCDLEWSSLLRMQFVAMIVLHQCFRYGSKVANVEIFSFNVHCWLKYHALASLDSSRCSMTAPALSSHHSKGRTLATQSDTLSLIIWIQLVVFHVKYTRSAESTVSLLDPWWNVKHQVICLVVII